MNQGEIWNANLNPTKGNEQAGIRPVVIVSGNLLNKYLNIVIAMPLTTKIKSYKGNPILYPNKTNGLKTESEMLIFQIRSLSKERLIERIGSLDKRELEKAVKTLNEILKY